MDIIISIASYIGRRKVGLSICLVVLLGFLPNIVQAEGQGTQTGEMKAGGAEKTRKQQELWNRAMAFLGDGNKPEAAPLFHRFYERHSDSEKAEDALWHAARLYKHLAITGREDDWDKIKSLYREFTVAFPESERLPRAYLEVGKAYMEMGYFREAVPYFGIIIRRFPERDIVEEASLYKSRTLLNTGRVEEAVEIYRELGQSVDNNYTRLANGYQYFEKNRYHDALGSFLKILKRERAFYLKEPNILRIMGECYLKTDQTEKGRKKLEHFLNLNSGSHRDKVLFQIGESYLKEDKKGLAAGFYKKARAVSEKGSRIHTFSRYRLIRFQEEKQKAEPGREVSEEQFVKIRESVIEQGNSGEVIQAARLELIEYYRDSQEIDKVYDLGKIYLNYASNEAGKEKVESLVCRILDNRLQKMLNQKKYEDVYQLYKDDYSYVKRCTQTSVRIKVGKALQELSLYDEASLVYWRAMKLEMSPEEKIDLYSRRVETYLAAEDYKSADTLLGHLRRIYADKPSFIGDVYFFSGKLSEARGNKEAALEFYKKSASESFYNEGNRAEFAEKYLNLLLGKGEIDSFSEVLERSGEEKWLDRERLQYWYVRFGDYHRKLDQPEKAGSAYSAALSDDMPADNEMTQKANLYYGDVQLTLGNVEKAIQLHNKASAGPDPLLARIAGQRLKEDEITRSLSEVE
ncbi:MAG: tetratricopeptide repeat protein [Desulfurivibrionaceae bacterium]